MSLRPPQPEAFYEGRSVGTGAYAWFGHENISLEPTLLTTFWQGCKIKQIVEIWGNK